MVDLDPQISSNPNLNLDNLNYKFNGWPDQGFARKNQNYDSYRHRFSGGDGAGGAGGGVQFRILETMEEDSGVCSPPLWRSNPRHLSPASRAQAIARGQMELMEMVKDMPETSYELSLKDIVEQRRDVGVDNETQSMEEGEERSILGGESQRWKNKKGSVKRQESNRKGKVVMRNGSIDNNRGLFIHMIFPFPFGSKKKSSKNSSSVNGSNRGGANVSPKAELPYKSTKLGGGVGGGGGDRSDWWRRKFTASSDSESVGITGSSSGGSTGRSGSSGSSGSSAGGSVRSNSHRKSNGCASSCWSFFPSTKRKS